VRICLYWNARAGPGHALADIRRLIESAGHTVACVVDSTDEMKAALSRSFDCFVAAGGDGTVGRAGRQLAGGDLPLAVLPLGTSNNIAISLGVQEDLASAIAAWHNQRVVRMDVGVVDDHDGRCIFLEGVGVGLLPAGIEAGRRTIDKADDSDRASRLDTARTLFLHTLGVLEPRHYGLTIEGTSFEQDSLLVEVLNIPCVGPRIRLSDEANPADGMLSVVVGGVEDRASIAEHLRSPWDDREHHARLKHWRAARVEVRGWHHYHVDDEVRVAHGETVSIHVEPGALPVLA
jgi:diacylglycerol kinase family enzyme